MKSVHIGFIALTASVMGCGGSKPCDRETPGNICTIAGTGVNGYNGDVTVSASEAEFSTPMGTLAAPDGGLYIDDWNNHRIRLLTTTGEVQWVAGNGELGGNLDSPLNGDFNHPTNIIFDSTGQYLYMAAWHNSNIKIIDPTTGNVTTPYGTGKRTYTNDNGLASAAAFNLPTAIAWDPHGNLTILDEANQVIRSIDMTTGVVSRIAGNCVVDAPAPGGPGACAVGVAPAACPAPSDTTVCGAPASWCSTVCSPSYFGDEGPALEMRMAQEFGQSADPGGRIAYDTQGNLFFADTANDLIRMIDTQGIVHRIAGQPPQNGLAQPGYSGDNGPATQASINHPIALSFGSDGTLYFADTYNDCIRAIAPDQTITTVVGQCGKQTAHNNNDLPEILDGVPATKTLLNVPYGVEWAPPNTLYIADSGNSVIRAVNLATP
jgi:hypothetical protein